MDVAMDDVGIVPSKSLPEQLRALVEIVQEQAREIGLLDTRVTTLEHMHEDRIEVLRPTGLLAAEAVRAAFETDPAAFEALDVPLVDAPTPKAKRGRARKEGAE